MKTLSVCYITCRRDCKIDWWLDSLRNQNAFGVKLIVVDLFHSERDVSTGIWKAISENAKHVPPKPNVWNGDFRITKQQWFAASSQRNTALCMCDTDYVAFCDDLSVLMPGWMKSIEEAMDGNYIVLGAYEKVRDLIVSDGAVSSCTHFPGGQDSRLIRAPKDRPTNVDGGWLYGCSLAGPVEAFLTVNGWPEFVDGLSSEDYCMGICLENAGFTLRYDPRMMTYESEELHFIDTPMKRCDWHFENGVAVEGGNGSTDKSHAALNIAKQSRHFPNYFEEGGIRALRQRILSGEQFPIMKVPEHDWFTGKALSEL